MGRTISQLTILCANLLQSPHGYGKFHFHDIKPLLINVQLENIPVVDAPECESLDFSDLIDGYRQYAGPANLAGKRVVSSECGAVHGEAFFQTLPELLWHVKRSYAGSVNQFVFHGFPYSGQVRFESKILRGHKF